SRIGADGETGASYAPNLLKDTKGPHAVTASSSDAFAYRQYAFDTPIEVKAGDKFTVSVEDIEVLAGNPSGFTALLYNTVGAEIYSGLVTLTKDKKHAIFTVSKATTARGFNLYAGVAGSCNGNSVRYTKVMLVKGETPMEWAPASSEMIAPTITGTSVTYAKTTTNAQPADSEFTATGIGSLNIGRGDYLWSKTVVTYSDGTETKSYGVSRIGSDGNTQVAGLHIAYATDITGSLPHPTSVTDFATSMQAGKVYQYMGIYRDDKEADSTDFNDYEWTKFKGDPGTAAKIVVVNSDATAFMYSDNFATLVGPSSINLSATLQGTTGYQWSYKRAGETVWTNWPDANGVTANVNMLHNGAVIGSTRSVTIRCTSGGVYDEVTIVKVSSGTNGINGNDAYTVLLTNESHIFEGDTEKAIAGSAESYVIAYKGATQIAVSIGSITGMPTGMTVTTSNNGTTSAKFTVKVTTALTTKQGTLNVPVTVDGKTFTQVFSWSLSLKGNGIDRIEEEYCLSDSSSTPIPNVWYDEAHKPTWVAGKYMWTRSHVYYTDGTDETFGEVCATGEKGESVYMLDMDNEMAGVACKADGTVLGTLPSTNLKVFKGGTVDTGWAYAIVADGAVGCKAIILGSKLTVTAVTADTASVTVEAKKTNMPTLTATMSVYKVKPGGSYQPNLLIGTKDGILSPGTSVAANAWGSCAAVLFEEGTVFAVGDKIAVSVESITQLAGTAQSYTVNILCATSNGGYKNPQLAVEPIEITRDNPKCVLTIGTPIPAGERPCLLVYPAKNGQLVGCQARYNKLMAVRGDSPMEWSPAASEMLGTLGYSVVASVSRTNFTEAQWNTYGTTGHVENWSNTESIRNGCRVGDYFRVYGTATDTGASHVMIYRSDTASGTLHGECVAHEVANAGEPAVVYQIEPSVDSITKSMTGRLSRTTVACAVYRTTGNSARVLAGEMHLVCRRVKNGVEEGEMILAHTNGISSPVPITAGTEAIIFELYTDGSANRTLLDRERVPVLSDASDMEMSARNLLLDSMECTVTASSTGNYTNKAFELPVPLKKGDFLALMVEGITNLAGSPSEYTVAIYNKDLSSYRGGGELTATKRTAVFEITADEANPKVLFYAGKAGATAGKSVKYTKAILVKGNVPMQTWMPAPEDTGAGVNLLRNSRARLTKTYTSTGDWYNLLKRLTVYMEQGKTYTISGRTNCAKFTNVHSTPYENKCVLWLCSTADSPQGVVNEIVSGSDMTIDGSRGHTFVWNHPSGEYFLRVNFYAAGTWWVEKVKVEKGSYATEWTPSPEDVEYLEGALKENTKTKGGLILTSTVSLGQNNDDYTSQTTWSGINGIYKETATGGGIALWFGGDMLDMADYYNWSDAEGKWIAKSSSTPSRIAKGIDRFDGSGYRAGGNFWWDKDGNPYYVGTIVAKGQFAGIRKNRRTVITTANQSEYIKKNALGALEFNIIAAGCYIWIESLTNNVVADLPANDLSFVGETIVIYNNSSKALSVGNLMDEESYFARNSAAYMSTGVANKRCLIATCGIAHDRSSGNSRIAWYFRLVPIDLGNING
ncbi:MAG: hypothetical protein K2J87_07015, partial [Muribaculaceae bacterium]|nr:hypothetical protein [Muribaculaceae bacterium]